MSLKRSLLFATLVLGFVGLSISAVGGSYIYNFGSVLSGGTPGSASTPWLTAEFTDVAPGQVRMTFTASHLTSSESVNGLLLNLNPALNPCLLVFQKIGSVGSFKKPRISAAPNAFRADGAGRFDLRFQFNGHHGASRQFGAGDQVTYLISGIPGLTAASFDFTSFTVRSQDPVFAAAKLRGIAQCDGTGWIYPADGFAPVPEPTFPVLLGSALATLGVFSRLRRSPRSSKWTTGIS